MVDCSTFVPDQNQAVVKTEVENVGDTYDAEKKIAFSETNKTDSNVINDIKQEPAIKQEDENEEMPSVNQCKLEVETFDEFSNINAKYIEEFNICMVKDGIISNDGLKTETKLQSTGNIKSLYHQKSDFETEDMAVLTRHLKTHKRTDTEVMRFECNKCDYITIHKFLLRNHQLKHSDRKPFKCDECSYRTKTKGSLKTHRIKHTQVRPYKCEKCDYSAKIRQNLELHLRRKHDEVITYKCDECDYVSNDKRTVVVHQKLIHHNNTDEIKIYKCEMCNYKSKRHNNLKQHQLVHKNIFEADIFKCYSCDYISKYKSYLKHHIARKHTIEFNADV